MEEAKFYFQAPETREDLSDGANAVLKLGAMASRLAQEKRTHCKHPDGRAENVAEHSYMLSKIAPELAAILRPDLDRGRISRFCNIHDDVEAYVGDTPTHAATDEQLAAKQELEAHGLEQLKQEYRDLPDYVGLVQAYEAQEEPEARFVRVVDKLMTLAIHFGDDGKELTSHFTIEEFDQRTDRAEARLLEAYPDFTDVVALRRELATVVRTDLYKS